MTYADINKMFTAEVSKYLARGYHFNTASMSGSQGETAKVDLTNGTEIIRVLLRTFSDGWDKQGTELFVGRVAGKENVRRDVAYCVNTIWNNRLEPVSSQRFYEVNGYGDSNKFYGTEADAEAVSKVRMPFRSFAGNWASRTWTRSALRCSARRITGTSSAIAALGTS